MAAGMGPQVERVVYLLVDDAARREDIRRVLERSRIRVRSCGSVTELPDVGDDDACSCVIVDGAWRAVLERREGTPRHGPLIPVVVVARDEEARREARERGAFDCLTTPVRDRCLLRTVQRALEQDWRRHEGMARRAALALRIAELTERECEVMTRLVTGWTSRKIADDLQISVRTAEGHRRAVLAKIGVSSAVDLLRQVLGATFDPTSSLWEMLVGRSPRSARELRSAALLQMMPAGGEARPPVRYWISPGDEICDACAAWDEFARRNGGPAGDSVIGRPVAEAISDPQLAEIYLRLFQSLRQHPRVVELPFRCDSPTEKRVMRMHLQVDAYGEIEICCELQETRPFAEGSRAPDADKPLTICAWCARVEGKNGWEEIEAPVTLHAWRTEQDPSPLSHVICDDCSERIYAG